MDSERIEKRHSTRKINIYVEDYEEIRKVGRKRLYKEVFLVKFVQ